MANQAKHKNNDNQNHGGNNAACIPIHEENLIDWQCEVPGCLFLHALALRLVKQGEDYCTAKGSHQKTEKDRANFWIHI